MVKAPTILDRQTPTCLSFRHKDYPQESTCRYYGVQAVVSSRQLYWATPVDTSLR